MKAKKTKPGGRENVGTETLTKTIRNRNYGM